MAKLLWVFFAVFGIQMAAVAQENSPYSRYGLGDLAPNHNVTSRAMGGIAAGLQDVTSSFQGLGSVNFVNPATLGSLGYLRYTIFDLGSEFDSRTLRSVNPVAKYNSANAIFSYLQLGVPLSSEKMRKKQMAWGLNFGLKPLTKINYKIEKDQRLNNIDSLRTLYEGTGGSNEAFVGMGFKIKNLSIGATAGYVFGNKNYSTKLIFVNDTIDYYKSNSSNQTTFGGLLATVGFQYEIPLSKDKDKLFPRLRIGAYGNLQQKFNATRDDVRETFNYDANNATFRIDSVYESKDVKGKIQYPSSYGAGFTYQDEHLLFGADYETTNWSKYSYYGQPDLVQNNWIIRVGGQYFPAKQGTSVRKYFNFVKYRAGFYYGTDYIKINSSRPDWALSVGTGMPLTSLQRSNYYTTEFVVLNTALEIGNRGDKNATLKETTVRFSVGISMNANWFIKRKYN
ncbi:MAG: hypothetical protein JST86_02330 [Bacteroidetes bacterium]|nr:hypothetical protein [Bacteroidota bacterium]